MRTSFVFSWALLVAQTYANVTSIDEELIIPNETDTAGTVFETCPIVTTSSETDSTSESLEAGSLFNDTTELDGAVNEEGEGDRVVLFENVEPIKYPFQEKLTLKPLPRNFMAASFQFQMSSNNLTVGEAESDFDAYRHYTVFPKALSPILEYTQTRQLHIRFTHGRWDAESWGQLPHRGSKSGGNGVELWAVIEASNKNEAFDNWISLANSLSGLFCSSINFIDIEKTTYPVLSFQPAKKESMPIFNSSNHLFLIRAALANEPICTENLTPFLKLLPTRGRAGISSLLDGHKVFDSNWHSLSIDVETRCEGIHCKYYMEEYIEMVFNVPSSLARADKPIPKPLQEDALMCDESKPHDSYECFPLPQRKETKFELSKLFGKKIIGSSLISEYPSKVCAVVSDAWNVLISVGDVFYSTDDNCFTVKDKELHDLHFESENTADIAEPDKAPIFVSRSLTGYGQDSGGLRVVFRNPGNETVTAVYFESLPWYMRLYLSSLKLESEVGLEIEDVIKSTFYLPAIDRERPTHLEFSLSIPANTSLALSYQFDKALLKYAEYPPDANHGFEIESAVVTVIEPTQYEMRTSTLLLSLSTPDFSMPYNVIILTSTIMGLAFGTLYNLMVKRLVTIEEADKKSSSRRGLKSRLLSFFSRIKRNGGKVDVEKKQQ
ncbi:LANO_0C08438g1_1 [Lachancea nothofagi CBS 11611]|uniref:LANO_0C08438g1_1 n=1 Tax=Lachancea nothofagi CBS 11611 TaxID=1266666 RepID=A0A1G4J9A9_9SACH|nr:LANO_0C08438g1_1 [Lachancea nothofagi CBS 11611]